MTKPLAIIGHIDNGKTSLAAVVSHVLATQWRCPACGCQTYARVDERKPDGKFGPGPQIRCVSCKRTYDKPIQ
jgi:translation elongation factor EF-Tu-like GTPase